jgi:TP901 family phage tail tape measure protein
MAQSDLDIIVGADTRNLNRKVDTAVRRLERKGVNLNTRKGEQALGRITGKADEFTKSLEASNARVIAFGASVAVIEGVRRSFVKLVTTIIEVESQLTSINSILGQSSSTIKQFGNSLFDVAKQTGQSFQQVAQTAQEFARQGLSVEQTLQRTSDALILTRLTTLKTDEAVSALTATINGFQREALTSTQVINKLRAVETSFAVSSDDLASALARSASVAQGAGVSFNELLGVITAIKQRTGLGGATIGQGLKTVFTRLNLPTRVAELKALGVQIDESANGFEKLRQVAIAYKAAQNANNQGLATQIGVAAAGQFQISKLSAAFDDLSNSYSVADAAALKSLQATNEANKANEAYNQTIGGLSKTIAASIGKILNSVGELGTTGAIKDLVLNINSILEAFQGNTFSGSNGLISILNKVIVGAKEFGYLRDAAEGFAKVLTGPGLVAAAAVIKNLFSNTLVQGGASLLSLTGVNKGQKNREQNQAATLSLLKQGTIEEQKQFTLATSQAEKERVILGILQKQLAIQTAQELQYLRTADAIRKKGLVIAADSGGYTMRQTATSRVLGRGVGSKAEGTIPDAIIREQNAINKNVGGATSKARVQVIEKFNYGRGKKGPAVVNSEELIIPNKSGDIVLNKAMMKGGMLNKKGFNFAAGSTREIAIKGKLENGLPLTNKDKEWLRKNAGKNPAGASNRSQNKILPATAGAIAKRGGKDIYLDTSDPSARRERFSTLAKQNRGRSAFDSLISTDAPSKTIARKNLINRGASGGFENLSSSGGGFAKFNKRQRALDRADVINKQNDARDEQLRRNKRAQEIRAQRRRNEDLRSFQEDARFGSQKEIFTGEREAGIDTRFSAKDRANIQADEYRREIKRQQNKRGLTNDELNKTPAGKALKAQVRKQVRASVGNRFFEIDKQIAQEQVSAAQVEIQKQSRKGLGRIGIPSFRKLEKSFEQDKNLTPLAKSQLKEDIQNRRFQRNQGLAQKGFIGSFALSAAAPALGRGAEALGASERTGNAITGAAQGAATGLAAGALFGPTGAGIGLIGGALVGGVSALTEKGPSESEKLAKLFGEIKEKNVNTANAITGFLQSESLISDLISSGDIDEGKILDLQDSALQKLQKTGLSIEDITKLTSAKPKDRGNVAAELQKNLNSQTNIAESKAGLAKILEEKSGTKFVGKESDLSVGRSSSFGVARALISNAAARIGISNADVQKVQDSFSKIILPGETIDGTTIKKGGESFQEIEKIIFSGINLDKLDSALQASGGNISQLGKDLNESFLSGNVAKIQTAFNQLGISIFDLPKGIRSSADAFKAFGEIVGASFEEGGKFDELNATRSLQKARVRVSVNDAKFGQAQLSVLDAQRSITNVNSFNSRLAGATQLKRQRSNIEIANSRFGIKNPERDDNFKKIQELQVNEETLKTENNKNKILDEANDEIRKFIQDPTVAGDVDNEELAKVLAKMGDGISSLEELGGISTELKKIFEGTDKSSQILGDLYLKAAESVELEKSASNDRLENIKIVQNQASAIRQQQKNASTRSQMESEMGMKFEDILGTGDKSLSGVVQATSEFGNTTGVNKILKTEADETRKGFIAALQLKDEDGEFKISQGRQTQMLADFDRQIKKSGRVGSGISKFDVSGRVNSSLDFLEDKYSKEMQGEGFTAFRNEVTQRGKSVDEVIASTPKSVREEFTEIEKPFYREGDIDPILSPLEKTQRERAAVDKKNKIDKLRFEQQERLKNKDGYIEDDQGVFRSPDYMEALTPRPGLAEDLKTVRIPQKMDKEMRDRVEGKTGRIDTSAAQGYDPLLDPTSLASQYGSLDTPSSKNPFASLLDEPTASMGGFKPKTTEPEANVNPLAEALNKNTEALAAQEAAKGDNEFLKEMVNKIGEGQAESTLAVGELKEAIVALNTYMAGDSSKETFASILEKLTAEPTEEDNKSIETGKEMATAFANSLKEGLGESFSFESKVDLVQKYILSVESNEQDVADFDLMKAELNKRIDDLEALMNGDVKPPK